MKRIIDLEPYSAMKDSGAKWLGEVPEHWEMRRLRDLSRVPIRSGVGESAQEFRSDWPRCVRITDIAGPRKLKESNRVSLPPEFMDQAPIEQSDILLAADGATYGKTYLHVDASHPACFGCHLVRWRLSSEVIPEWASYWTESNVYWDQVHTGVVKTTIEGFTASKFRGLSLALPPLLEQVAIARYLDHFGQRVRRLVRSKRKLIALLKEQKQAIIHRAVTRGLDPSVPLKDSGVEWLGEVPEHWEVVPNRALFDEMKERDCPNEEMLSVTIKRGVIKQSSLLERTSKKDNSNLDRSNYKLVQPGDIAYNKMRAWQGAIGVSKYRGIVSPAYVVLRPRIGCESGYFNQLFRTISFAKEAERNSYGIASDMWSLRPEHFKLIRSCLPPPNEQVAIQEYLTSTCDVIDTAIDRATREIRLLEEFRTRLVSDVVTGKLDVREAASDLPEIDPLEVEDDLDEYLEATYEEDFNELEAIPEEIEV